MSDASICALDSRRFLPTGMDGKPVSLETADASSPAPLNSATRTSRYGYGIDVRATYAGLQGQWFWTWLTGKDHRSLKPRQPRETLLSNGQMYCQLAWSWSIIFGCLLGGHWALHAQLPAIPLALLTIVLWVLVVNRTRGLLHTFHYTSHGAGIQDMELARWLATYFMSIPILHLPWDNYRAIHAVRHHSPRTFCTDEDPDQQFMTAHGFKPVMTEREFWTKLVLAPFSPARVWDHIWFRLRHNFIETSPSERWPRILFLVGAPSLAGVLGALDTFALYYLFPLFIVTQFSSWLQHTTEHLWYSDQPADVPWPVYYGALTWGRFLGRPYPVDRVGVAGLSAKAGWWCKTVAVDLPIRLFSFMQDLPSHDFHHRSARVNFWSIARERAAREGLPSRYGPMTETWGLVESWLILRDHLCRGEHDPFGIYDWHRHSVGAARDPQVTGCLS